MIRKAVPADAAALAACAEAAYAQYVPLIGRRPAPMDADFPTRIAAGEAWAMEGEGGGVVGYVILRLAPDHALLENVAVRPGAGGGGAAAAR